MPNELAAASTTAFRPSFDVETVFITGHPSLDDSIFSSIFVPFFSFISLLLSATTTGIPSSKSWVVKNNERLRFVASTILIITSGLSCLTYELVIDSSLVNGDIEYAPGRSTATS